MMKFLKQHQRLVHIVIVLAVVSSLLFGYVSRTSLKASVKGPLFGESQLAIDEERVFTDSPSAPDGMRLAAKNAVHELYINPVTADFAVLDIVNNNLWHSNPQDSDDDSITIGDMRNRLRSQLFVEYYNVKNQTNTMNSYFDSVLEDNFEILPIQSGFKTVYTLGRTEFTREMLPQVIEKERFESLILSVLSDEDMEQIITRRYKATVVSQLDEFRREQYTIEYPELEEDKEYYILDIFAPAYEFEEIYTIIFNHTDYTNDDFVEDNTANGIEVEQTFIEMLTIPLEVTINEDGMVVNIPASEIIAPENLHIRNIHVLEYFGAGSTEEEGYMLLPDGSGAIVNFNNGKTDAPPYAVRVYGQDHSIKVDDANVRYPKAQIPIFAENKADAGFLAIIEEGEAHATIHAKTAGQHTSYNNVHSSYNILPVDFMTVDTGENKIITNRYQQEMYQGNIRISYRFTGDLMSDYSDFAVLYRDYLIDNGILKALDVPTAPFVIELLGRVETEKSIMGIPYTSYEELTSFSEGRQIVEESKAKGIQSPVVKYSSWFGGNSQQTMSRRSSFASGMGGQSEFDKLTKSLDSNGLYLNTSLLRVHRGLLDFNYVLYGARHTYNEVVGIRPFNIATNHPDIKQDKHYLLSPRYLKNKVDRVSDRLIRLNADSLWLDDMGSILYSDFSRSSNIDRQESIGLIQSALEGNEINLGFDAPNQYVFPYISKATGVALVSSGHRMEDETVPFLPIVLSGTMEFTGPVINLSGKAQDDMLKAVETGSGLNFKWIHADNTLIRELEGPEPQKIYSLNYKEWIDQASEFYSRMVAEMDGMLGEPIVHHTKLEDNVYKTTWEIGSVIVNYNETPVTIDGKMIDAKDYLVMKGDR